MSLGFVGGCGEQNTGRFDPDGGAAAPAETGELDTRDTGEEDTGEEETAESDVPRDPFLAEDDAEGFAIHSVDTEFSFQIDGSTLVGVEDYRELDEAGGTVCEATISLAGLADSDIITCDREECLWAYRFEAAVEDMSGQCTWEQSAVDFNLAVPTDSGFLTYEDETDSGDSLEEPTILLGIEHGDGSNYLNFTPDAEPGVFGTASYEAESGTVLVDVDPLADLVPLFWEGTCADHVESNDTAVKTTSHPLTSEALIEWDGAPKVDIWSVDLLAGQRLDVGVVPHASDTGMAYMETLLVSPEGCLQVTGSSIIECPEDDGYGCSVLDFVAPEDGTWQVVVGVAMWDGLDSVPYSLHLKMR